MSITVSIVIPIYNASTTITQTLSSLFKQNDKFDELILIDDNSTDNSAFLIKTFFQHQSSNKVKIITNSSNIGLAESYNKGIVESKGDLLITMHSDIILKANALAKLIAPFSQSNSIVASYHQVDHPYSIWNSYNFWQKCFFARLVGKKFSGLDGKFDCFKIKILKQIGGFDSKTFFRAGEDGDITYKLQKIGKIVSTDAEIVHIHNRNPNFDYQKIIYKQAQYSQAQGVLLKKHGITNINKFTITFFREILLISLLIPILNIFAIIAITCYMFIYTKQIYLREYRNPRIIFLPWLNLWLLFISLNFSIEGYLNGKQTI